MADLWRTKLRSLHPDVNNPEGHARQVAYCLERNVVGVGWGADLPTGSSLDEVVSFVRDEWGAASGAKTIKRFARAAEGEFVWTRDTFGKYHVCRLESPWRFEQSEAARSVDIHQVRDVTWLPTPVNDSQVPGAVIRCFVGTGSSFSRVNKSKQSALALTRYVWAVAHGEAPEPLALTPSQVLTDLLDPYDVEDLVYVWLQVAQGYVALPRARQRDTPVYEFSMLHRDTGRRGIVQVKTGGTPVDKDGLAEAITADTDAFAFATSGRYHGTDGRVHVIDEDDLLTFVVDNPECLPARIRWLFELSI